MEAKSEAVGEALQALGLQSSHEKLEAVKRLGGQQLLHVLASLGDYLKTEGKQKTSTPAASGREGPRPQAAASGAGALYHETAASTSAKPPDSTVVVRGAVPASPPRANFAYPTQSPIVQINVAAHSVQERSPEAAAAPSQPAPSAPPPAQQPPSSSVAALSQASPAVQRIVRSVQDSYSSDPYQLYYTLKRHAKGGDTASTPALHRGLAQAGIQLSPQDFRALMADASVSASIQCGPSGEPGRVVDVAAFVQSLTGPARGASSAGLCRDRGTDDSRDLQRFKTCRAERSLKRHLQSFIHARGVRSLEAFVARDKARTGHLDKAAFSSVLREELGLVMAPSDLEVGLRQLPVDQHGRIAYASLLTGASANSKARRGLRAAVGAPAERGSELASRVSRTLNARFGCAENAFRAIGQRHHPCGGGAPSGQLSRRELRCSLGSMGVHLEDADLDLLVRYATHCPADSHGCVDIRQVISALDNSTAPAHSQPAAQAAFPTGPAAADAPMTKPTTKAAEPRPAAGAVAGAGAVSRAWLARDARNNSRRVRECLIMPGATEEEGEDEGLGRSRSAPPRSRGGSAAGASAVVAPPPPPAGARSEETHVPLNPNRYMGVTRRLYDAASASAKARKTEHHSDAVRALLDPEGSHASQPVSRWALSPPPRSRAEVWGTRDSVRGLLDPDKQAETGAPSVEEDAESIFGPGCRKRRVVTRAQDMMVMPQSLLADTASQPAAAPASGQASSSRRPHGSSPSCREDALHVFGALSRRKRAPVVAWAASGGVTDVMSGRLYPHNAAPHGQVATGEEGAGPVEQPPAAGLPTRQGRGVRRCQPSYPVSTVFLDLQYGTD